MTEAMSETEFEQYELWVENLAKHCTCTGIDRPCDGLMAGGLCDDPHLDREIDDVEYERPHDDEDEL